MNLTRVSETIKESKRPASYYRAFLKAAQGREFQGVILLADVLKLPPAKKGGKHREVSDYAVLQSPDFEKWHAGQLAREGATGIVAPRFADLIAGTVDPEEAARDTLKALDQRAERNRKNAARLKKVRKGATSTDD